MRAACRINNKAKVLFKALIMGAFFVSIIPVSASATITGWIQINDNAAYANQYNVTLKFYGYCTDSYDYVNKVRFSSYGVSGSYTDWESYDEDTVAYKEWSLLSNAGTVYVQFKTLWGEVSAEYSDSIIVDTNPPIVSPFIINSGNPQYTASPNATLYLYASDAHPPLQMCFSNDNATWSAWEPYLSTKAWTLASGDGTRLVYVQVKDAAGNIRNVFDKIILDTTPPVGTTAINAGDAFTSSTAVILANAVTDVTSGMSQMRFSNDNATWSAWEPYAGTKAWSLATGDGLKTVYAQFRDNAQNVLATTGAIVLDTLPPTGSIAVNGGAQYTKILEITLTNSIGDSGSGLGTMCFSNDNATWSAWEPYAGTKAWSVATGDGLKTVYARFADQTGNVSATLSDSIILDASPPTGTVLINNGAAYSQSSIVTLNFTVEDASNMVGGEVRYNNFLLIGQTPWESYSSTKAGYELVPAGDGPKQVVAQFRDAAGNESAIALSNSILVDTTAPVGTVTINAAAAYTNTTLVTLTISAVDATSGLDKMRFSNTTNFTGATWMPYAATTAWSLSDGDGTKTVNAEFQDKAGNISTAVVSNSIILDATAPTGTIAVQGDATYTRTAAVTLNLSATDNRSGLDKMRFSNDNATWSELENYAATKSWTLTSGDGTKTVYVRFVDQAGNVSATMSDSIILDATPPTGTIAFSCGAYTRIPAVTLNLSSAGGATQMCFSANQTSWMAWEDLATTRLYNLVAPEGLKWVYVKFRDAAGNESGPAGASVTLDTLPPTDGTLQANPGNQQVTLKWSGFSDVTSGLQNYKLYYSASEYPTSTNGDKIYEGAALTFIHEGLVNGKPCYYRLCAVDKAGNVSTGATATATPKGGGALPFLLLLLED